MLIKEFRVPIEELVDVNLAAIEMSRLGRFIALTGKNGAGKSRVLNKLNYYIHSRNNAIRNLRPHEQNSQNLRRMIANNPADPNISDWQRQLADSEKQICLAKERLITENPSEVFSAIQFVPKQLNLSDPRNFTKGQLQEAHQATKQLGFEGFERKCFSYIQAMQDQYWEATHQNSTLDKSIREELIGDYNKLVALIETLLKTSLSRSIEGNATIFGKPLAESNLSDGQKILIQFIVAMHAQKANLENTVFLMDEPENHLHPSALIEFLDSLIRGAKRIQCFFATHSIPLLSYVSAQEPMSIWYVEEGKCGNAGRHPEKVLNGLLGNEEQIASLHAFTSLPAQFAALNYAVESLAAPLTLPLQPNDPQIAQINQLLSISTAPSKRTVLDFGAGKGRLLVGLADTYTLAHRPIEDELDYLAFDAWPDDREICGSAISEVYKDNKPRYFGSREEFFSVRSDGSVDVVVMCNVLHEIPPNEWLLTFNEESLIHRALRQDGYLLIIEDQRIPTGEKAHEFGFIVLDTAHLRTLFAVTDNDCSNGLFVAHDYRKDGRLKGHLISKKLLGRLNSDTRKDAIKQLQSTAMQKIRQLRNGPPSYINGQANGFWTQQFANTSLFLEQ